MAVDDLALVTNLFYRCANLHCVLFPLLLWCTPACLPDKNPVDRPRSLFIAVHDATTGQIVWAELNRDAVAGEDADKILPHAAGDVREDLVLVLKLNLKHGIRQGLNDRGHYFNCVFLRHPYPNPPTAELMSGVMLCCRPTGSAGNYC
jgi:hypothetical protein